MPPAPPPQASSSSGGGVGVGGGGGARQRELALAAAERRAAAAAQAASLAGVTTSELPLPREAVLPADGAVQVMGMRMATGGTQRRIVQATGTA